MTRETLRVLLAFAILFPTASAAGSASAVPAAPATSAVEAKRAEREAALAALERSRASVQVMIAEYIVLGRDIERTRAEISQVASDLVQLDLELERSKEDLRRRAVQLYRGGRVTMLEVILEARSVRDLMDRASYLSAVALRDARLMTDVRRARTEREYLYATLTFRADHLAELQQEADDRRLAIERDVEAQEALAAKLGQDIVALMRAPAAVGGSAPSGAFDPEHVITDANFRDVGSMTAADIQAFLEQQPGILDTHRAPDHTGKVRSTAEMIAEAATAFNVSPKVILATLQKEQSLLGDATPKKSQLDWAMGAGKADTFTTWSMMGFGNQIWWGAQKLDKNADLYQPGATLKIDGSRIAPVNGSTFGLYRYTPHFRGTMSFWLLYWRYFGDPLAG